MKTLPRSSQVDPAAGLRGVLRLYRSERKKTGMDAVGDGSGEGKGGEVEGRARPHKEKSYSIWRKRIILGRWVGGWGGGGLGEWGGGEGWSGF